MGCRGTAFWDGTRLNVGCLREEQKMGKERDQGGLGRNKHG